MKKKQSFKQNLSFIKIAILSTIFTIAIATYISYLIYYSKNSYQVYDQLKTYHNVLKQNIVNLQQQNAQLQKEYFELQNLEPEQ